jgi:hypothetical protein
MVVAELVREKHVSASIDTLRVPLQSPRVPGQRREVDIVSYNHEHVDVLRICYQKGRLLRNCAAIFSCVAIRGGAGPTAYTRGRSEGNPMSDEGVRLLIRAGLVIFLIVAAAVVHTGIGGSKRRGRTMLAGTVAGLAGVLVAGPLSQRVGDDVSVLAAVFAMVIGWAVSWRFARRIPLAAD